MFNTKNGNVEITLNCGVLSMEYHGAKASVSIPLKISENEYELVQRVDHKAWSLNKAWKNTKRFIKTYGLVA